MELLPSCCMLQVLRMQRQPMPATPTLAHTSQPQGWPASAGLDALRLPPLSCLLSMQLRSCRARRLKGGLRRLDVRTADEYDDTEYSEAMEAVFASAERLAKHCQTGGHRGGWEGRPAAGGAFAVGLQWTGRPWGMDVG